MSHDPYRVIFNSKNECSPKASKAGLELVDEVERLREALRKTCWDLANYTFRGKPISLGEEADALFEAAVGGDPE